MTWIVSAVVVDVSQDEGGASVAFQEVRRANREDGALPPGRYVEAVGSPLVERLAPGEGWRVGGQRHDFDIQAGFALHCAKKLLERFGSLARVFEAEPASLEDIDGIGGVERGRC